MQPDQVLLTRVVEVAERAGRLLLRECVAGVDPDVTVKQDGSPLTYFDTLLDEFLTEQLSTLLPGVPVISEEGRQFSSDHGTAVFWLVDPIDGTRAFVSGSDEYCISIALVCDGVAVLGVIHAAQKKQTFYSVVGHATQAVIDNEQFVPRVNRGKCFTQLSLVSSRFSSVEAVVNAHQCEWLNHLQYQSSALKFCSVASGQADVYLRFGATGLWDTAAGQVIVEQAGGCMVDFRGKKLQYKPSSGLLNSSFMVLGDQLHVSRMLEFCQKIRGEL